MNSFALLLNHGLDMQTMIRIAFRQKDPILQELEQGKSLADILTAHCKGKSMRLLSILAGSMSFQEAYTAMEKIEKSSVDLEKKMMKSGAYPVFLFLFAYAMIVFFTDTILPQMIIYDDGSFLYPFMKTLKSVYTLFFVLLMLFLALFAWFSLAKKVPALLEQMLLKIPMLRSVYTYQFSVLFEVLLESGLNTREYTEVLSKCQFMRSVRLYYPQIRKGLSKGISLLDVLSHARGMDSRFSFFVSSGMEMMSLPALLELYGSQTLLRLESRIKKISAYVQIAAYASVGILVLTVYQVMLMPLNMLNSF